jgi:hypothetical protein
LTFAFLKVRPTSDFFCPSPLKYVVSAQKLKDWPIKMYVKYAVSAMCRSAYTNLKACHKTRTQV